MTVLARKQRCLRKLCLGLLDFDPVFMLDTPLRPESWLSHLTVLDIPTYFGSHQEFRFHNRIIDIAKSLSTIRIRCCRVRLPWDGDMFKDGEPNLTAPWLFKPYSLFWHSNPTTVTLRELNELTLDNVELGVWSDPYFSYVDFLKLKRLEILHCRGWEDFLKRLQESFENHSPALTHFTLEVFRLDASMRVEPFLRTFQGLEMLFIHGEKNAIPDSLTFNGDCLAGHAATLRTLFLCFGREDYSWMLHRPDNLVSWIAQNCISLKQPGVVLPNISIEEVAKEALGAYGREIELLARLPQLRFLQVLNIPEGSTHIIRPNLFPRQRGGLKDSFHPALDVFATAVFNLFYRKKLRRELPVICFGDHAAHSNIIMNSGDDGSVHCPSAFYVPLCTLDHFGNATIKAVRKSRQEIAYIEPPPDHILLRSDYRDDGL